MEFWMLAVTGLMVGTVVGLTGMGGGAILTPILLLGFKIPAMQAISTDIVVSLALKPVGGAVHAKRGTVWWSLVFWISIGSIPMAFLGVYLLEHLLTTMPKADLAGKILIGSALLLAVMGISIKAFTTKNRADDDSNIPIKVLPTVLIGIFGGFMVGLTSIGSGSLMGVLLLALYPKLTMRRLVGTDLVLAVPLIASATLGHHLWGDIQWGTSSFLIMGAIPGVFLGAQISSRAPDGLIRPILAGVLLITSLKLLQTPIWVLPIVLISYWIMWAVIKHNQTKKALAAKQNECIDGAGI